MSPSSPWASPTPHASPTPPNPPVVPRTRMHPSLSDDDVTQHHHRVPESGTMPCFDQWAIPSLLRGETLYRLYELFEEELGSELDCHRIIAGFGASRDTVPRRLAGPLLVALSQKLHPERRVGFLRDACGVLHDYEGTPRVLV